MPAFVDTARTAISAGRNAVRTRFGLREPVVDEAMRMLAANGREGDLADRMLIAGKFLRLPSRTKEEIRRYLDRHPMIEGELAVPTFVEREEARSGVEQGNGRH